MSSTPGGPSTLQPSDLLKPPSTPGRTSKLWLLIPVAGAIVLVGLMVKCGTSLSKSNDLSRASVQNFHSQLNREDYQGIFSGADSQFQNAAPQEETLKFLKAVHRKLGNAGETKFQSINVQATGKGTFIVAQYVTTFEKGPATESFTWRLENGSTRLVGYNINSNKLVTE